MKRRLLLLFICFLLIINFTSCQKPSDVILTTPSQDVTTTATKVEETKEINKNLSVHFSVSDSLNPYASKTAGNQQLCTLMYDGLIKLDENLNVVNKIASEIKFSYNRVIVTLKSVKFSDGSSLSAEDVEYSLDLAKNSKNGVYKNRLSNIKSYAPASVNVIEFVMKEVDPNFASNLDFPILKRDTLKRETDDGKPLPPIGCGRYVYYDDSGVYSLKGNQNYYGSIPKNQIDLVNIPDKAALQYNIKAGEVDVYYSGIDVSDVPAMSGGFTTSSSTNLVFLGINSKSDVFKSASIRNAISSIINREEICKLNYFGYAQSCESLYPNGSNITKNATNIFSKDKKIEKSIEHLAANGYNNTDNEGYYIDEQNNRLLFELLYNEENTYQKEAAAQIVRQLKIGGVESKLVGVAKNEYFRRVDKGEYQIYIGEIKLSNSLNLNALFSKKFNRIDREADSIDIVQLYDDYLDGKSDVNQLLNGFSFTMPFIPIAYRSVVVSCLSRVTPKAVATVNDAYYNIEQISVK